MDGSSVHKNFDRIMIYYDIATDGSICPKTEIICPITGNKIPLTIDKEAHKTIVNDIDPKDRTQITAEIDKHKLVVINHTHVQ